jgi:hypothetical protein
VVFASAVLVVTGDDDGIGVVRVEGQCWRKWAALVFLAVMAVELGGEGPSNQQRLTCLAVSHLVAQFWTRRR